MTLISEDGGAVNLPKDLLKDTSTPDTQRNYFEVTLTDLNVNTTYPLQFAWVYEDKTVSEYSATYNVTTNPESTINAPSAPVLNWGNGYLEVRWDGKDSLGNNVLNFRQVNIWIRKEGDATSVKSSHFFVSSGFKLIPLAAGTYNIKLQAETMLGEVSSFSTEVQSVSYKPPLPASGVSGVWEIDTLKVAFTFDSTAAETSTNSNTYADYFRITLTGNSVSRIFYSPVNKSSSAQLFYLTSELNKSSFGLFTTQFNITVQVVDSFGNTSTTTSPVSSATYSTPLSPPVISVTKRILGYTVSYTSPASNLPFDQIYIYESTDGGTTYNQVAQGKTNPIIVNTTNTTTRSVKAKFFDSNGLSTADSNIFNNVTPDSAFAADTVAPNAPTAGLTASSGIDTTGTLGFNGFINLSWNEVSDSSLRGYRIRFRPQTTPASNYAYVDAPGVGTTYRISGLAVGSTATPIIYEVGIASYDEFNNTTATYTSFTNQSIGGTPAITDYITAGNFQFGQGIDPTNTTGITGTKRGLFLDSSNYWLLNASNSARLKVGGTTSNYLLWDGSEFIIDGDLRARKGNFSGNVTIAPGGSLMSFATAPTINNITAVSFTASNATYTAANHGYVAGDKIFISGLAPDGYNGNFTVLGTPAPTTNTFTVANTTNTALTDQVGTVIKSSGTGFVLSKDGIKFNSSTTADITTIDAATGKLTTSSATIGGWDVSTSTIAKNGITLDSSADPSIVAIKGSYYVGIKPNATAGNIVLWAGQSANGSSANFRVAADGSLNATGATISGSITVTGGNAATTTDLSNGLANKINVAGAAADVNSNATTISGGKIRTGVIQSTTYTAPGGTPSSAPFSQNGMQIVLDNQGSIISKNFVIDSSGNAFFKGQVSASSGDIAGWTIGTNTITKGTTILDASSTNGFLQIGTVSSPPVAGNFIRVSSDGIHLGHPEFSSAPFRVTPTGSLTANDSNITGIIRVGGIGATMAFGTNAGGTLATSGLYVSPNNFWYTNGSFSMGTGIITGTSNSVTFNLTSGNSVSFANMPQIDDDNLSGSNMGPTITLRSSDDKLVKGRRFIFDGGATNPPANPANQPNQVGIVWASPIGTYPHSQGTLNVRVGDILMVS